MQQVETGCKTIFRFDDVLDRETCAQICNEMYKIKNISIKDYNANSLPWVDEKVKVNAKGDTFDWVNFTDIELKKKINKHRNYVVELASKVYNKSLYPRFTDLVLWREGRFMLKHKDNGYSDGKDQQQMASRKVSTVTYLNDDYTGGETFIANETGTDYISSPKTGSVVFFLSDETNEHGVNKVVGGNRVTLPIWVTDDKLLDENRSNWLISHLVQLGL